MTGKVLDNGSAGILILIIPIAFVVVILYKFWLYLLILASLIVGWKVWDNYQWQKWSEQINPYFNQLIRENKGYLTPIDLSLEANLTPRSATVFLARKADEYGINAKNVPDKGVIYYFPTASALGSIFDDSEPLGEFEEEEEVTPVPQLVATATATKQPSKSLFRELAEQKAKQEQGQVSTQVKSEPPTSTESIEADVPTPAATENAEDSEIPTQESSLALIQADLAKRLDVNPSTVGRNKDKPNFPDWSQSKDPDGLAWKYVEEQQLFVTVEN